MTLEEAMSAVRVAVEAALVTNLHYVVQMPGEDKRVREDAAWVGVTILPGQQEQVSTGAPSANRFRRPGVVIFTINTPMGLGDGLALQMASNIEAAFRAVTIDDVVYQAPWSEVIGANGKWYQVNTSCPFYVDHLS